MCRDAELHPADFVTLVLSGVGVETDLTAVQQVLGQARTAIDQYAPRDTREALNDRFVTGLARLLKDAEAGSDHQLAFARSLISAAKSDAVVQVLQAWLAGEEAPAGLAIDTDLRWHILTNLARAGVAGEAEIEAELARDATARGAEKAAGARAARPSPEAKAEAWRLATADDSVANETHFQICTQFWQYDQDEALQPVRAALPRRRPGHLRRQGRLGGAQFRDPPARAGAAVPASARRPGDAATDDAVAAGHQAQRLGAASGQRAQGRRRALTAVPGGCGPR